VIDSCSGRFIIPVQIENKLSLSHILSRRGGLKFWQRTLAV